MEQTKEQKTLKTFSVLELIFAIMYIIFALVMIFGGGLVVGNSSQIAADGAGTVDQVTQVGGVFIGGGISFLISAVICLLNWHFLKKVSKDATAYKGAWILTIIGLVFAVIGLVSGLLNGASNSLLSNVIQVALNAYILYLINKIGRAHV